MGNQDVEKDGADILFDMLTKSQMSKDNNDHDVDMETLYEDVICKDESLLVVYAINIKVSRLFTKGTQSIDDMTPPINEDFDLIDLDMEHVVTDKSGNTMLFAEEDGCFCNAKIVNLIAHLREIRLIPRQYCIMKLKLC